MREMSQVQLADALDTSPSSMNLWEQGRRLPPVDTLLRIATFFDVSLDYLLRRSENPKERMDLTAHIEVAQLPALHGAPVWLEKQDAWVLVDSIKQTVRFVDGSTQPFSDLDDAIWGMPPPYTQSARGASVPLTSLELPYCQRVWVEPISNDALLRRELRGWYDVSDRYVSNEFGNRFYLDRYGAIWVAFRTVQSS